MSQIISAKLANQEISGYLQNAAQASHAVNGITDVVSKKYFTTPPSSFVVEKKQIEDLWNLNPAADGLKVYNASHSDGTPTIVLVACKNGVANLIADQQSAAVQYATLSKMLPLDNFDINKDNG